MPEFVAWATGLSGTGVLAMFFWMGWAKKWRWEWQHQEIVERYKAMLAEKDALLELRQQDIDKWQHIALVNSDIAGAVVPLVPPAPAHRGAR